MTDRSTRLLGGLGFSTRSREVAKLNRDFGGMRRGEAVGLIRPRSTGETARVVEWARSEGRRLTPRGGGQSQGGQSLSPGGIVLLTERMREVRLSEFNPARIRCGAGATWRGILAATLPHGLVPPVVPLDLDLTVGGTLSAGGLGTSAHRMGPALNHVHELEVVIGRGELHSASRTVNRELFDSVPGGAGRFGVLCEVELLLRPAQARVTRVTLSYDDLLQCMHDQRLLGDRGCDHVEGVCLLADRSGRRGSSRWEFTLHFAVEHRPGVRPPLADMLAGLAPRKILSVAEDALEGHLARHDAQIRRLRQGRRGRRLHPWFEAFLPAATAAPVFLEILAGLPTYLGTGHRFSPVGECPTRGFFMTPLAPRFFFSIQPAGIPDELREATTQWMLRTDEKIVAAGGKRYLSGWLPQVSEARWRWHFGRRYAAWRELKCRLDPDGVFTSTLFAELDGL